MPENPEPLTKITFRCRHEGQAICMESSSVRLQFARWSGAKVCVNGSDIVITSPNKRKSLEKLLGWEDLGDLFVRSGFEDPDRMIIE